MKKKIKQNKEFERYSLYQKLSLIQSEIGAISKDSKNPFYKSNYFDINSLIRQLNPLLHKHNLLLLQPIIHNHVKSIIYDIDGGFVESLIELPKDLDAQKLGSAITYYRRYTLQSLLALQAVDDDGNLASHGIVPFKNQDNYKKKSKPILLDNTPQFKNALEAISKRGKTINDIKEHYIINKEIEKKLLNFKI
tara:strand:+ start:1420 stop:1998 length:579 start_codon:yes stop_codon:yes gene_type:complete